MATLAKLRTLFPELLGHEYAPLPLPPPVVVAVREKEEADKQHSEAKNALEKAEHHLADTEHQRNIATWYLRGVLSEYLVREKDGSPLSIGR